MANQTDNPNGCTQPETLRRYYLDIMGIQLWESLDSESDEQPALHSVTTSNEDSKHEDVIHQQWQQLQQSVASCTLCDLHQTRTQTVFGVGDIHAKLLVIGEAPGHDEDVQGEPFVGRAGQLLTAMLLAIGLQRDNVYITNILKCRPPNNRDPEAGEVRSCNAYLRQQIDLIQPAAILAVGRIAAQTLLDSTATMGALRARQHSYQDVPLIASYHPAYLLRKPTEKRKAWQDLLMLKRLLEQCR